MPLSCTAVLSSTVGENSKKSHALFIEPRNYLVIEHICSRERRLLGIELRHCDLAVGINECLLIDSANSFDIA